ncbi:MAG: uracil-DNA glycosylase [Candidatus Poribacteria bacterium]
MAKNTLLDEYIDILTSVKSYVEDEIESGFNEVSSTDQIKMPTNPLFNSAGQESEMAFNTMDDIRKAIEECHKCPLYKTRTNMVFGSGNENAKLVFVGEAPGYDEDQQGKPFVGKAGQKLTQIINAIGLSRDEVYITNVLKCRPPNNRNPLPHEIEVCEPFLIAQLQIIKPKIICALGTFAAQTLLKTDQPISKLRGRFHTYQGIKLMPTYHPAFLLRSPKYKKDVWEDVQKVRAEYDKE